LTCAFNKEDTGRVTENPFLPPAMPPSAPNGTGGDRTAPDGTGSPAAETPYTPADGLDQEAPYGYTVDRKTGERRPRKRAGRGVRVVKTDTPGATAAGTDREPDKIPGRVKPEESRPRRGRARAVEPPEPIPPFRAGPIAKGVNRLYRKAGKIVRVWDAEIGQSLIECTRKDVDPDTGEPDAEDVTVGEAWEEIAKVNPRIRRILLRLIEGGAWGALFMAHAPILLAILTKESVMRRLPLARLLGALADDGDDGVDQAPGMADLLGSLTPEDLEQAAAAFSAFMPAPAMPDPGVPRRPEPARPAVYEELPLPEGGADAAA
jgi:hypothetical protein